VQPREEGSLVGKEDLGFDLDRRLALLDQLPAVARGQWCAIVFLGTEDAVPKATGCSQSRLRLA